MISPLSPLGNSSPLQVIRKAASHPVCSAPALPSESVTLSAAAPTPTSTRTPAKILLGALTAVSGLAGLAGTASILIHNAHKSPAQLQAATVKAMLADDTPLAQPSPETLAQLQKALAPVDVKLLQLAQSQGITYQLVEPGADFVQAKVLRLQSKSYIHDQLPQLSAFAQKLQASADKLYGQPMNELAKKFQALPAGGFFPTAEDPAQTQYHKLNREQTTFLLDQLEASRLPVKLYSVPIPGDLGGSPDMLQMINMQSEMPASLQQMAMVHGARSPEDIQEFATLVKAINGDRIDQAIEQTLDRMVNMKRAGVQLSGKTFSAQDEVQFRAGLSKNSLMVPLNHREMNLLVPNLYYKQLGAETIRLDSHDRASLESWSGQRDAKGELFMDGKVNSEDHSIRGQFFYLDNVNRILMRSSEVGKNTPIHELGHAMEHILEKRDPKFYAAWKAEVKNDYDSMMKNVYGPNGGTEAITPYAETNVGEYIAEGFAQYHLAPNEFKAKDPKFYEAMDLFVTRLKQLDSPPGRQTLGQWLRL